ncbi:MAG: hypothetical protein U0903_08840 [Planctomycetales bacterium]
MLITRVTGKLVHLTTTEATIGVGAFEYQVLIPVIIPPPVAAVYRAGSEPADDPVL